MAKKSGILLPKTSQWSILGAKPEDFTPKIGARGRTWTGTMSPSRDFKSLASAYSTTRAHKNVKFWEVFVNFEPRCWKFTAYRLLSPLRLPIPPQWHKNMKFFDGFVGKCEKFTTQKILSPLRLPIPPQRHNISKAWLGRRIWLRKNSAPVGAEFFGGATRIWTGG